MTLLTPTLVRGLLVALTLHLAACSSPDADDGDDSLTGGAPAAGGMTPGSGGSVGSGGTFATGGESTSGGGTQESGGTGGQSAETGGAPGAGGAVEGDACGTALAPTRMMEKSVISENQVDYALVGEPGSQHKRILLLMFNASSKNEDTPDGENTLSFYSPEELGDAYFQGPFGAHAFLNEASYGKVTLSGSAYGWIDVEGEPLAEDFRENNQTYLAMADGLVDFTLYDVIYIVGMTNDEEDEMQVGWGLENTYGDWIGGLDYMINAAFYKEARGPNLYSSILPSRSWSHEFIHTLGMNGHDIALDCGTLPLASECTILAYSNVFSAMGGSVLGDHPAANSKNAVGWFDEAQFVEVRSTTELTVCPTETVDDKIKGVVIPLKTPLSIYSIATESTVEFDRIVIEHRAPIGFDETMLRMQDEAWQFTYLGETRELDDFGVLVSLGYGADTDSTVLLDVHPETPFDEVNGGTRLTGKYLDAVLNVGETFEIAEQGISITPVEAAGGGVKVAITYE